MRAKAQVQAGVCGFRTNVSASCEDGQMVTMAMTTDCEKIGEFARQLAARCPVDAFQEISPAGESVILSVWRATNKGCCAACAVQVGTFKCMQVAAGLALPQEATVKVSTE